MTKIIPCLILLGLSVSFIANSQPVDLNRSFGNCGSITTAFNNYVPLIRHTLIKPDGKILSGGHSNIVPFSNESSTLFAQYNSNGTADSAFGVNGQAVISLNTRTICENFILQPDGKIVGVGTDAPDEASSAQIPLIFRLNADGTVDNSFGENGKMAVRFDNISSGSFTKVYILSNGKILAAGNSKGNVNGGVYGPGIMQFNADGSLDNSFGNITGYPGRTRITPNSNGNVDMLVQDDGKIILSYSRDIFNNENAIILEAVRFLPDGTIDNTFGNNGTLAPGSGTTEGIIRSVVQPDKKILFCFTWNNNATPSIPNKIVVLRYLPDFTPDLTFGIDGRAELDYIDGSGFSFYSTNIGLQPEGKILVTGSRTSGYPDNSPLVIRLNTNGQLDAGFNNTGFYFIPTDITTNQLVDVSSVDDHSLILSSSDNFSILNLTTDQQQSTGGALNFDGINDEVQLGNWFNYQKFSIEMWIKPGADNTGYGNILDNGSDTYLSWVLMRELNSNDYFLRITDDGVAGTVRWIYFTLADEWQHLAVVKDVGSVSVYINGELVSSQEHTGNIIYNGTQFLRAGYGPSWQRGWKGSLDELRLWDRPLTQAEIQNNMNCELSDIQNGMLAYYKFNHGFKECNNTGAAQLTDASGNNHNGSLLNFSLNGSASNWVAGNITGTCGQFITFYRDADADGFGNAAVFVQGYTTPAGYVSNSNDCNDDAASGGAAINPDATEVCNGVDDDCDGEIDEGVQTVFYHDADNDGYGNVSDTAHRCGAPAGYVTDNTDCDDNKTSVHPGTTEVCNGMDDDCDGEIDEDVQSIFYRDADNDGYGNVSDTAHRCSAPAGYVTDNTDCDDSKTSVHPGTTEVCNGMDDDCDGEIDEGVQSIFYRDADNDSYGNVSDTVHRCSAPAGFVSDNTDCDDSKTSVHPGATEVCNGIDDDCDGEIDESVQTVFYHDADNDGYGNVSDTVHRCSAPAGYVTNNTDCDDSKASVHPASTEVCNGIDDNCDGEIDEDVQTVFYHDVDNDGYGNVSDTVHRCNIPPGYVADKTDCDDSKASVYPAATEVCNGIDDNCDGQIDEGATTTFYRDADGDTYGSAAITTQACAAPSGYVINSTDCDDTKTSVHPGAAEACNGIDDDCNGSIDEGVITIFYRDADGDGYGNSAVTIQACSTPSGYISNSTDCDDTKTTVHPGAIEVCNGIDDDCDGQTDEDVTTTFYRDDDGDGYGNAAITIPGCTAPSGYISNSTDCNDNDASINPVAPDICDGKDNNCNGTVDEGCNTSTIPNWTWVKGSNTTNQQGEYYAQGIEDPNNTPGARRGAMKWTDGTGKLWTMGGSGYAANGSGYLNDVWKYDQATDQWTWMKGSSQANQPGVYGTQGVAATNNTPGSRYDAVSWTDANGKLWMMGGYGYAANGSGYLNDVWKYDPVTNQWTWIKGSNQANQTGVYGTQGVAAPSNTPGARQDAVSWTDASGKLWMMGGFGYAANGSGYLNDVWKYDPVTNQWTWIKGSNQVNQPGSYGTQGVTATNNTPGARYSAVSWTDANGKLWMMGGVGYAANGSGYLNDVWKYDPVTNQWTWIKGSNQANQRGVYGTQGVAATNNTPGARYSAVSWTDASGKLWMMGGYGYAANGSGYLNDVWKYDPVTNQWTWIKGSNQANQTGVYGTQGVAAPNNTPGSRYDAVSWIDANGKLWMMGGVGSVANGSGYLNDVWKYDPVTNQWTWIKGSNQANRPGVYGTQGVVATNNTPGARRDAVSWTDASGKLWMMGGLGYAANGSGFLTDVWKYDPATNQWTWIKGSNQANQPGVYGTPGVAATNNTPGARYSAVSWTDASGKLWMMGGYGYAANGSGFLNDVWKYDPATNQWTWIKGSNQANQPGVYGTQGVAAVNNTPGARYGAVCWTDASGKLWMMGGYGYAANGSGYLNDVWKYDPVTNQWTWIKGSNRTNQPGVYGTQGVAATNNTPGARYSAVSWTDASGKLWMMGGVGSAANGSGYLNDVWKYDPVTNQWTWIKGSNRTNQSGVYGTQGVAANNNTPGARYGAVSWTDANGKLWMMGGFDYASNNQSGRLNDVWKYDPGTNLWTWMKGSDQRDQPGVYGTQGVAATNNTPGTRQDAVSWTDTNGDLWLLGGYGYATNNQPGPLNDLWKLGLNQPASTTSSSTINMVAMKPLIIEDGGKQKTASVVVFPNPASQKVNLRLTGEWAKGNLNIQLIDRTGRAIKQWTQKNNKATITLNTAGITNGFYIMVIRDSKGKLVGEKLVIQH